MAHWDDQEVSFLGLLLPYICQTWRKQSNLKYQQVHTKMSQQNSALPKYQKRSSLEMQKTFRLFCSIPEKVPHTHTHTHTHSHTNGLKAVNTNMIVETPCSKNIRSIFQTPSYFQVPNPQLQPLPWYQWRSSPSRSKERSFHIQTGK